MVIIVSDISVSGVDRILRKAGAQKVNFKAASKLRDIIEELALEISSEAVALSLHADKKVLKPVDVNLALRLWKERNKKLLIVGSSR